MLKVEVQKKNPWDWGNSTKYKLKKITKLNSK
jgi:hypothetical protein